MSEMIVSCAGCGKRYKGVSGTQKYRCSVCENLFTFPEAPQTANAGRVLCSLCWAEVDCSEDLCSCPVCSMKIAPGYGGRAAVGGAASNADLQAIKKERDELREAKKKMEQTMGELMERVAQVEETHALERRGETGPAAWELKMELAELQTRLDSAKKNEAASQKTRDAAMLERNQAVAERDKAQIEARIANRKRDEVVLELTKLTEQARTRDNAEQVVAQLKKELEETRRNHLELAVAKDEAEAARQRQQQTVDDAMRMADEAGKARDAALAEIDRLKNEPKADPELEHKLWEAQKALEEARDAKQYAEREYDRLNERKTELEKKAAEADALIAAAEEARGKAERERDEAQAQLASFRDMAVSTLEPFAADYRKMIKSSVAEAEAMLQETHQAREANLKQLEKMERIAAELSEHLSKNGRELHARLADLLGLPTDSGIRSATSVITNGSSANGTAGTADESGDKVDAVSGDMTETKV